jgi:Spy/CpxP family protein refolding chaperone
MLRHSLFALSLVLAAPALGCAGTVTSEPPTTADTATTRAPVAVNAHGPVKLFGQALGDVPLTASQRQAIEGLATGAEARHAEARTAGQDLMNTLAAQVEAGQIDRAALQPKIDALSAAMQKAQPADRAAFEQLHAILTPDQRSAFVDAVEAHAQEMRGQMKEHHGLKQWAADLNLTDDQKSQIKDAIKQRLQSSGREMAAEFKGAKHEGKHVMDAFKEDRFVMDEVQPAHDVAAHVGSMTGHALAIAEAALPVLTPAQRTLAAQKIREKAQNPDGHGWDLP